MNDRVSEQQAQQDRALALMALTLDPQPPPPALRARLLAAAAARGRYLPFLEPLAAEFDLLSARVAGAGADRAGMWSHLERALSTAADLDDGCLRYT